MKVLVGLLIALVFAGHAQAATVIQSPNPRYQMWVDQAKVPTPDVTLSVIEADWCPISEARGCTLNGAYTIWIWGDDPRLRTIFFHELGHNYDYYSLTDGQRQHFEALTSAVEWDKELFASTYAQCARRQRWEPRLSNAELPVLRRFRVQRAACRLLRASQS